MATQTKPKFAGRWTGNPNEVANSNPGTGGKEKIYEEAIDNKGAIIIECVGERNLYQEIQSHKDEVLIENILKRVAAGDMSDFRPNGIYADTTEVPTNMIEAQKAIKKLEKFWNEQPMEVKNKYNNDVNQFIADAGSKAWLENTGMIQPEVQEPAPNVKSKTPEAQASASE